MPSDAPSLIRQKLVFSVAIVIICAVSLLSFISVQRLMALSARIEQTQSVISDLKEFSSDLEGVERGARGYFITGDEAFLGPYYSGVRNWAATLRKLRAATTDQDLAKRLDGLEQLGRERLKLAELVIALRPRITSPQNDLSPFREGKATMDRIRSEVDEIAAIENANYQRHRQEVAEQALLTNIAVAAGIALSLAALAWLFAARGREVRQRRRAEDELRRLNSELEDRVQVRTAELERSRELLNAVIENMPDTVFLKDARNDFRYVLINEAGERFLGRQRGELVGHIDHELFPREQAALCVEEDEEVVRSGRHRVSPERTISIGDSTRIVESRKVPIADSDGGSHYVLGIVRDVTDQRAVEDQLRQVQRIDAVGQLTGGIAHDFNNILGIIIGNVDLICEQANEGSEIIEMADEALGAALGGAELVKRLLAFARKQHLEPAVVDLNERLPSITALLTRSLGENIRLQVDAAPGLWKAMVDPTQVDDALVNLAINARDAMPNGGSLTIETGNVVLDEDYAAHHAEVAPGEYVMLAISDSGTGMPPEVIARAFEPFFTTKPEGRGTGLGLSQVYGWVKQSGGHIKIYSEVGHGTTIKLYLPRATASDDERLSDAKQPSEGAGGHEKILVVEDNPNVRKTVLRQLRELGYVTLEAEDAHAALTLIKQGADFDLLLTDVIMSGGITGYELADRVRELRPDLKVLFTSGYTELAAGNGDTPKSGPLLSKPYRKHDLGRAIRAVIDNGSTGA